MHVQNRRLQKSFTAQQCEYIDSTWRIDRIIGCVVKEGKDGYVRPEGLPDGELENHVSLDNRGRSMAWQHIVQMKQMTKALWGFTNTKSWFALFSYGAVNDPNNPRQKVPSWTTRYNFKVFRAARQSRICVPADTIWLVETVTEKYNTNARTQFDLRSTTWTPCSTSAASTWIQCQGTIIPMMRREWQDQSE